jgi:DNA primase
MAPIDPRIVDRVRRDAITVDSLVETITHAVLAVPVVGPGWRSPAQRGYSERLVDLDDLLGQCWRALDEAASELKAQLEDLDRMTASQHLAAVVPAAPTAQLNGQHN